jgi:hypothetical protein
MIVATTPVQTRVTRTWPVIRTVEDPCGTGTAK